MRDFYSVLGVRRNAGADEIKTAWRSKAKSVHPDHNQDDPEASHRFAEIGRAYEILKDPEKRNRYDRQREKAENRMREQTILQQRQAAREAAERAKEAKENAERILAELQRAEAEKAKADRQAQGQAQPNPQAQPQPQPQAQPQPQTKAKPAGKAGAESPEDVVARIFGDSPEAAAVAESLRREEQAAKTEMESGGASGPASLRPIELISALVRRLRGVQPTAETAPDMLADAQVAITDLLDRSPVTVTLPDGRDLRLNLDEGLKDGDVVRLKGQGLRIQGMQRGDVAVTIRVQKTEKFRTEGYDIHTVLPITLEDAVLGCEATVETPTGPVQVTIPPWSGSDQVIRIDDLGLVDTEGKRGVLAVELRVLLWEKPDEKVTDLMRLMRHGLFL